MAQKAYGSITITDLLDTATYIYYSSSNSIKLADWHKDARSADKYIGIYSGKSLDNGQPTNPTQDIFNNMERQLFVGEDGEDGRGISSVEIRYAIGDSGTTAPSTRWQQNVPSVPQGKYLWTRTITTYTTGNPTTTYSVSFFGVDGQDGADGILYNIETNHEKIYKFFDSNNSDVVFSPGSMTFKAYKISDGQNNLMLTSEYDTDIALAGYTTDDNFGHLWNFLNRLTGQNKEQSGGRSENLLAVARVIGNDTVQFNFDNLTNYSVTTELGNTEADVTAFNNFITLLRNGNGYFIYKIFRYNSTLQPSDLLAVKPIPFEFGTTEDMAKFALTANDIQMAVNNSKLTFDATKGLTVQNGGLHIISADGTTTLMEYDPTGNALRIIGNGEFTGTIHATEGEFTGDVSADTLVAHKGDIGGFIIQNNGLYSKNGAVLTEDGYEIDNSLIKLLGEEGRIDAENINLGVGAHINKYIQLGNAFLWNPDDVDAKGKLLEAGPIELNQNGQLKLGQITLNGSESQIYGKSFSIKPDQANFSNINVSGKISTAIFEQNHVQSVGGSMIFKPSYKIEHYESNANGDVLTLNEKFLGEIDNGAVKNYVYLVKADGSIVPETISIVSKNDTNKTVVLSSNLNLSTSDDLNPLVSLIDIGTEGSLIIGINSNDAGTGALKPRGLTITEFTTGVPQNPKVFLGDLDKSGITFIDVGTKKGFGLYSDNVYLTGSLTTIIEKNSFDAVFAGVNTLNGIRATHFISKDGVAPDTSKIVFWAGAADMSQIANAPFQVTEKGSLYAAQGLFEGAIISKSRIEGVDIYAARIHGWDNNESNSLTFYDAAKGIIFKKGDYNGVGEDTSVEIFSIGEEGLKSRDSGYFININSEGYIKYIGDEVYASEYFTDKTKSNFLHLVKNQILGTQQKEGQEENIQTNITFDDQELALGFGENKDIRIQSGRIQLIKDIVQMDKTVLFGEQLKYEQTTDGYNLYVL